MHFLAQSGVRGAPPRTIGRQRRRQSFVCASQQKFRRHRSAFFSIRARRVPQESHRNIERLPMFRMTSAFCLAAALAGAPGCSTTSTGMSGGAHGQCQVAGGKILNAKIDKR
jgi:hypothetical protein